MGVGDGVLALVVHEKTKREKSGMRCVRTTD